MRQLTSHLSSTRNRTGARQVKSLTRSGYATVASASSISTSAGFDAFCGNGIIAHTARRDAGAQRPKCAISRRFRVILPSRAWTRLPWFRLTVRCHSTNGTAVSSISSPVTIVGAGPAGLTLSALLSQYGVPSVLLEKASALPTHPQAHFINLRSMEILRHAFGGLDVDVLEKCPPREEWRDFVVCSSALGRELARVDNFSGGEQGEERRRQLSPTSVAHLSQNVLLPLLLREAYRCAKEFCPSSQIIFNAEATGLRRAQAASHRQIPQKLDLLLRNTGGPNGTPTSTPSGNEGHENASEFAENSTKFPGFVTCDYVVAADGAGSAIRSAAGIGLSGKRGLGYLVNIHFRCKGLGRLLADQGRRPGMLYFVYNQEVICVLVAHNVQRGEWACQVPLFPPHQTSKDFMAERAAAVIRHALGPGGETLNIEVCSVRPWTMNAVVADSYFDCGSRSTRGGDGIDAGKGAGVMRGKTGSVFLLGDAAHQFPPAGGFGLNTGVQDAHNLAWKLAAVHHGLASPELLHTYEQERRPVAKRNAALSVRNLKRSFRVTESLGVDPNLGASAAVMDQLVRSPLALNISNGISGVASSICRPQERSEKILRLGRSQLKALRQPGHPYGDWRVRSLHRLLNEGGGLPLLFPEHDVGFTYSYGALSSTEDIGRGTSSAARETEPRSVERSGISSAGQSTRDGESSSSTGGIKLGGRMPHFVLCPPSSACHDAIEEAERGKDKIAPSRSTQFLSTVDLPDQIRGVFRRLYSKNEQVETPPDRRTARSSRRRDVSSGGYSAGASLASVLIVVSSSASSQTDREISRANRTADSASARWTAAAVSAQQEARDQRMRSRNVPGSATPPPPTLVLLTVLSPHPGVHGPVLDCSKDGLDFGSASAVASRNSGRVRETVSDKARMVGGTREPQHWTLDTPFTRLEHLAPYLDDSALETRAAGSTKGEQVAPAVASSIIVSQTSSSKGDRRRVSERAEEVKSAGVDVLSMVAVDDPCGTLGKAFVAECIEAILIRPDGHVAWIARRGKSEADHDARFVDEEVKPGHEGTVGDAATSLQQALDAVYGFGVK